MPCRTHAAIANAYAGWLPRLYGRRCVCTLVTLPAVTFGLTYPLLTCLPADGCPARLAPCRAVDGPRLRLLLLAALVDSLYGCCWITFAFADCAARPNALPCLTPCLAPFAATVGWWMRFCWDAHALLLPALPLDPLPPCPALVVPLSPTPPPCRRLPPVAQRRPVAVGWDLPPDLPAFPNIY